MPEPPQNPPKPSLSPRALLRTILMLDDTPHSIALGTAIGMFVGLTPTVGIQMAIVMMIAFLVRPLFTFNKVAALLLVYISNPLTVVPLYWGCYKLGTYFVEGHVAYEDFARILEYHSFAEWWNTATSLVVEVGAPLLVGSLIVATVTAIATYPIMLTLIRRFRPARAIDDEAADTAIAGETGDPAV